MISSVAKIGFMWKRSEEHRFAEKVISMEEVMEVQNQFILTMKRQLLLSKTNQL